MSCEPSVQTSKIPIFWGDGTLESAIYFFVIPYVHEKKLTYTMLSQKCSSCGQLKSLDQYHVISKGLTGCCISCLDLISMQKAMWHAAELAETLNSLPTIENFYSTLEVAKEDEALTHIIPFYSKPLLDGHGVQTV